VLEAAEKLKASVLKAGIGDQGSENKLFAESVLKLTPDL